MSFSFWGSRVARILTRPPALRSRFTASASLVLPVPGYSFLTRSPVVLSFYRRQLSRASLVPMFPRSAIPHNSKSTYENLPSIPSPTVDSASASYFRVSPPQPGSHATVPLASPSPCSPSFVLFLFVLDVENFRNREFGSAFPVLASGSASSPQRPCFSLIHTLCHLGHACECTAWTFAPSAPCRLRVSPCYPFVHIIVALLSGFAFSPLRTSFALSYLASWCNRPPLIRSTALLTSLSWACFTFSISHLVAPSSFVVLPRVEVFAARVLPHPLSTLSCWLPSHLFFHSSYLVIAVHPASFFAAAPIFLTFYSTQTP